MKTPTFGRAPRPRSTSPAGLSLQQDRRYGSYDVGAV